MIAPTWESTCGRAKLWLGDCVEVLKSWEPSSVDVVLCDPPYGHGNHVDDWNSRLNKLRGKKNKPIVNDDAHGMRETVGAMLLEAARIMKQASCCCCCCCGGGGPRPTFAWLANRLDSDGLRFFHSVIWDKRTPGLGWRFRRQHEMLLFSHREGGRLRWADNAVSVPNIVSMSNHWKSFVKEHPNQKPTELFSYICGLVTRPGDIVVDPFMGSGTTGVSAIRMGTMFRGIELDENYLDIARRRIEDELRRAEFLEPRVQDMSLWLFDKEEKNDIGRRFSKSRAAVPARRT